MASLKFADGVGRSGLTPVSLSLGVTQEASIVREILQNSLDAVTQKGKDCAHVCFSLEDIFVKDIPGIEEYKKAVTSIASDYRTEEWPEQTKEIVEGFEDALEKQKLPVLFVSDNGTGLNQESMTAILSDGDPVKGGEGANGSHGNGHFTTFNLSNMRYILYGGASEKDGRMASGHAILANHEGEKTMRAADGYFIEKFGHNRNKPFHFPKNEQVTPFLLERLKKIEVDWGTGTVLAIIDFNFFGKEEPHELYMENLILGAAIRNFFVVIKQGLLDVTVKNGSKECKLTKDNHRDILERLSPNVPRAAKCPTHSDAMQFSSLLSDCLNKLPGTGREEIKTSCGSFDFFFRQGNVSPTRIALCRNGMWITNEIPCVRSSHFDGNIPFEGLLLCDASNGVLHSLVRKSEGNLHNSMKTMLIKNVAERTKLKKALREATNKIKDLIKKQDGDVMDFLEIKTDSIDVAPPERERIGRTSGGGSGGGGSGGGGGGGGGGKNKRKPGRSLLVNSVSVKNDNSIRIRFMPMESTPDMILKLVLNGGSDSSCSGSENASIDIQKAIYNDGKSCSVVDGLASLGEIEKGKSKTIIVNFKPSITIKTDDYRVDCQFTRGSAAISQDAVQSPAKS